MLLAFLFGRGAFHATGAFADPIRASFYMKRGGQVLEMRRADVVDVLGVESAQLISAIERCAAFIVGALETFPGRIEDQGFIEIQITHVIDRQLVVEADAVRGIEFHGRFDP